MHALHDDFLVLTAFARKINKRIAIIDVETTGLLNESPCGIVEFGSVVVDGDGSRTIHEFLINPGFPIPPSASKVHGIYDHHVRNAPTIEKIKKLVEKIFESSLVCGFNIRTFDIPFIVRDFSRYGIELKTPAHQIDVREVYIAASGTQKGKLHEVAGFYDVEADVAHRAAGDIVTTARILEAMILRHGLDFVLGSQKRANISLADRANHKDRCVRTTSPPIFKEDACAATQTHDVPTSFVTGSRQRETKKARIMRAITAHVSQYGYIAPSHYETIAQEVDDATPVSVSFCVGEMYENNWLHRKHIEDPKVQAIIRKHIDEAISEAGGTERLKPIKEALDRRTGENIDYNQIRIALKDFLQGERQ